MIFLLFQRFLIIFNDFSIFWSIYQFVISISIGNWYFSIFRKPTGPWIWKPSGPWISSYGGPLSAEIVPFSAEIIPFSAEIVGVSAEISWNSCFKNHDFSGLGLPLPLGLDFFRFFNFLIKKMKFLCFFIFLMKIIENHWKSSKIIQNH